MLAIEANDEWLVGRAYISQKSMAALYAIQSFSTISPQPEEEELTELLAA